MVSVLGSCFGITFWLLMVQLIRTVKGTSNLVEQHSAQFCLAVAPTLTKSCDKFMDVDEGPMDSYPGTTSFKKLKPSTISSLTSNKYDFPQSFFNLK